MNVSFTLADVVGPTRPILDSTRRNVNRVGRTLKHRIQDNPLLAVGLALGTGVVVGWLVKRR